MLYEVITPGPRPTLAAEQFDVACQALADFVDIKTPYTMGHSHRVADLAAEAARRSGLPEAEVNDIRRAGWLHDIGRTGVSAGIWMKQESLTEKEWEQVAKVSSDGHVELKDQLVRATADIRNNFV